MISAIVFAAEEYRIWLAVVVVGYVAVVATQFVPFALSIVPVVVAVEGNVAVDQVGAAAPPDCNIWPVEPAALIAIAEAVE